MSNTVADKIFRFPIVRTRALLRTRGTAIEMFNDTRCAAKSFGHDRLATVLSKRSFKYVEESSMVKWHILDVRACFGLQLGLVRPQLTSQRDNPV